MEAIGLDIGTTTICGILMNADTGEMIHKITLPNDTAAEGTHAFEKLQDPDRIEKICRGILEELAKQASDPAAVGITGQMHGIVYLDREGRAVSPLISWQDQRGAQNYQDGKSYAEVLSGQTGYRLATGFGAVTHYYNTIHHTIPKTAVCFCTIADYIAARLTKSRKPRLHESMAASLGLFQMEKGVFDTEKIKAAGMDPGYFPEVMKEEADLGVWEGSVKVSPALGDNQASFLGSVDDQSNLLVNVGTGSQVSVLGNELRSFPSLECRPFLEGKYLYVGSSLCGGYSYSLLEGFFEEVLEMCGVTEIPKLYEYMNAAGQKAGKERNGKNSGPGLTADTRFMGSRENPKLRGRIEGISPENFRPGELVLAVLEGICRELLDFYRQLESREEQTELLPFMTGSGNGIRRNPLLRQIFSDSFHKKMRIPLYAEEAAYGSALFSLYTSGICRDLRKLQKMIPMEETEHGI